MIGHKRIIGPFARPIEDRAEGESRVKIEGPKPLAEIARACSASETALLAWIGEGRSGGNGRRVWLDGYHHPRLGWVTSVQAVVRFRS